ncbi:ATP-binding cassette domain-containing protein [Treponema berlinense]|uniref:ATP-binding cassette domain-containing protein n=1 Tax=Treponema berlinense TaxID=225004 RepID=UPI0026F306B2|nr:ATP-binding cassette domain-containing protein [Treponema berlinense]
MERSLISLKNVRIQDLKGTKIDCLDWQMNLGEAWLVIGPNGGGKADFLQALSGKNQFVDNVTNSTLCTCFENSTETVSLERAALLIQEERDLDESEYMDRIDEGRSGRRFICEVLGGPDARHRSTPLPPIASRLETLPEVKLCGVEKILDRGLKFMSTGEIRRTLLCRALLSGKKLLILSDPFAGLDAQSRSILLEFFQKMVKRQNEGSLNGTSIILAMERYHEIPDSITNVLEFTDKKVSFCGTKKEYESLLAERNALKEQARSAEKQEFLSQLSEAQGAVVAEAVSEAGAGVPESDSDAQNSPENALVCMNGVNVGWDGRQVLKDFSWTVLPGQHWFIRGPNGSGKTTLLELITGDNKQVYCNDVWLFGHKRGTGESIWDIKKNLGIVSYRLHVEYRMVGGTCLEDVIISGFRDSIGLYEQKTDMEISAAKKWLKLAGFEGREQESFGSLSYGEQRAVLIMRAAVKSPKLLILDEPCHGLDEQYRQKILDLLETVALSGTTTLLHVTHDPTEVLEAEKHILELCPGEEPMYRIIEK